MEMIGKRPAAPDGRAMAAASGMRAGSAGSPPKPAMAFKQEMARAMEGWGPDAPRRALQAQAPPVPRPAPAAAAPGRLARDVGSVAFRDGIARLESGAEGARGGGHAARNPSSGALGRYQLLPVALQDIGWLDGGGRWTAAAARHGVRSEAEFLSSPAAQEAAMDAYLRRAEQQLDRNGSLARAGRAVPGLDGGAVPVTEAGLIAAAHRRGANSVARYLSHRSESPDAPLTATDRQAFAAVERRLRDFAAVPYALASVTPGGRRPREGTG